MVAVDDLALGERSKKANSVVQRPLFDQSVQLAALPPFPDDPAPEGNAPVTKKSAGFNQNREALLLLQPCDGDDGEGGRRRHPVGSKSSKVNAVVDAVDLRLGTRESPL